MGRMTGPGSSMRSVFVLAWMAVAACEEAPNDEAPDEPRAGGSRVEERPEKAEPDSEPTDDRFVLEARVESYETFVDIHPRHRERPGWGLRLKEASLRPRWDRDRPRSDQVDALAAMLERLHREHGEVLGRASVMVSLSALAYPEYVERLARHAVDDPAWKARRDELQKVGSPRLGALHGYIVDTTREHRFHAELDRVFDSVDMHLRLKGVEKCGAARPGQPNELGRWLEARGLRSRMSLPIGCLMAWFELKPGAPGHPDGGVREVTSD